MPSYVGRRRANSYKGKHRKQAYQPKHSLANTIGASSRAPNIVQRLFGERQAKAKRRSAFFLEW